MDKNKLTPGLSRLNDPKRSPRYTIVDSNGNTILEVEIFLRDVIARTSSSDTVRTYRDCLFDFLRYLTSCNVKISDVKRLHVVDYLLHLKEKKNPQRNFSKSGIEPGSTNEITGKPYLSSGYQARTLNLRQTVVGLFFDVLIMNDMGPERHPIVRASARRPTNREFGRTHQQRSLRQRVPAKTPVVLADHLIEEMMQNTVCLRDAALLQGLYCSASRAIEMLGLKIEDILWDKSEIMLKTKGRPGKQPVRVTEKFLTLTKQYLAERGGTVSRRDSVWLTERSPTRQLTYTALRAILRRLNDTLGSNVTAHNFRSTCASKLAQRPGINPLDIQNHLRHSSFDSTQIYIKLAGNLNTTELNNLDEILNYKIKEKSHVAFDTAALARVFKGES